LKFLELAYTFDDGHNS